MKSLTAPPKSKTEVPCPGCSAVLVVSPNLRWTKMQCPKCRAVIALPGPGIEEPIVGGSLPGEAAGKATPERAETTPLEARLSTLEARIAALEQELGSLKAAQNSAPRHRVPIARSAGAAGGQAEATSRSANASQKLIPEIAERRAEAEAARAAPESSCAGGALSTARAFEGTRLHAVPDEQMVQKLAEILGGRIAIRVKEGDAGALQFGEWLGHVFIMAGWAVTTLEARRLPPEDQNLTLATSGNFPFPKMASTIHRAFSAAGLGLVFGIDPASDSPIPTLIVPRWPAEASDHHEAETPGSSRELRLAEGTPQSAPAVDS